jgi:hypothetical protein
MIQIQEFVNSKLIEEKATWLIQLLFQLYYFKEELTNCDREIQELSKELAALDLN